MVHFFRFTFLLLGYININPGPNTVNNNSISLNTLPFHNCDEPTMTSESNSCNCYIAHDIFKQKKGLHIFHLNINSLLPKTDEFRFIAKQSNASIIGINESKLDSSISYSELDIEDQDLRLELLRR